MTEQENEIADLREKLAQAENERNYYRSAIGTATQAVLFVGIDGRIKYANEAFYKIAGQTATELQSGQNVLSAIIHPDDRPIIEEKLRCANAGENASGLMRIGHGSGGHQQTLSFCAMQMHGPGGEQGVHISITDLSAEVLGRGDTHKQAEQSDQLYKWILDKAPIPIYRRSFGTGYEYFNDAFIRTFECGDKDVNLKYGTPEQRWLDPAEHDRYISQLLKNREVLGFEIRTQPINGISKTLLLYAFIDDEFNKINGFAIDVTAQKQLQQSVEENQLRIKSINDNFTQGLIYQVVADKEGRRKFTYLSQSVTKLYGVTVEEELADASLLYRAIYPDDAILLQTAESESLATLRPFKCEARFVSPDGSIRWSLLTSTPTRMPDGSVSWDGIEFDITDRKTAELALQEREAQYRFITENMMDVVWVMDVKRRRFAYLSPSVFQQRGYTAEEAMNQSFEEILTPESSEKAYRLIKQRIDSHLINTKHLYSEVNELEQYRKDGSIYPVELATTITFDDQNKPLQIIGITRDISERKRAEQKFIESENRYRSLFENANDAIIIIKDYRFIDCNSHSLVVYGCKREEIIGQSPMMFSPETQPSGEESRTAALRYMDAALMGVPQRFEWVHTRLDKTPFYAEVSLNRLETNGEVFLTAFVRDTTEKKNNDIELARYRDKLEDLVIERTDELATTNEELIATNEELYLQKETLTATLNKLTNAQDRLIQAEKMASLGVLAAGIAHEINNPLNFIASGIYGFEAYFEDHHNGMDETVKCHLNAMYEGVRRASEIVKSLNQYSRSSGSAFESCNVNAILDNCTTMLSSQLKNRVEVTKQYATKCTVTGNEGRLHQAFLNILSNACQAIEKTGTIRIATRYDDKSAIVEITDNGGGIPAEILPKIFDPFFTTKDPGQGTGLGLSISLNIIKEHGGTIDIDSVRDAGTAVRISFPLKP